PFDAAGSRVDDDRASGGVIGGSGAGVVVLPVAAAEAGSRVEKCTHRADVGDVPGEITGQAILDRPDEGVTSAVDEVQYFVTRNLFEVPDAPLAVDAAFAVERDQLGQCGVLFLV